MTPDDDYRTGWETRCDDLDRDDLRNDSLSQSSTWPTLDAAETVEGEPVMSRRTMLAEKLGLD